MKYEHPTLPAQRVTEALQEAHEIYRAIFPLHDITIIAFQAIGRDVPEPEILLGPEALTHKNLADGFAGSMTFPARIKSSQALRIVIFIQSEEDERNSTPEAKDWSPSRFAKLLYVLSPLAYEQVQYLWQAIARKRVRKAHDFEVLLSAPIDNQLVLQPNSSTPEQKRPAIIIGFHWLEIGGAENLAFDTVEWALEAGLRVFVVASVNSAQRHAGRLPTHQDVTFIRLDKYLPKEFWPDYLERLVKEENIRIIHIHHCASLYDALPHLKLATPHVKVVDSTHIVEHANGGYPRISGINTNLIDVHHVISRDLRRYYEETFFSSEKVKIGRLLPVPQEPTILPEFSLNQASDQVTISFVGRMHYQKRPLLLFQILKRLKKWAEHHDKSLKINIVGEGEYRAEFERNIIRYGMNGLVEFFPSDVNVPNVLGESDILLLPSNNEGLALVCYEAIRCGCIPISTNVGAQRELIPDELLVPWPPLKTMSHSVALVKRLVTDADFREKMIFELKDRYNELLKEESAKSQVSSLYQSFLRQ